MTPYNRKEILPEAFYRGPDPVAIARALLGCYLVSEFDGLYTAGRITETEAYRAPEDQASHARNNRRTERTETMFGPPGRAYIYLCYGIHHLFNVVTGPVDTAHAVLIRGLEPADGVAIMARRRGFPAFAESTPPPPDRLKPQLSAGPGVLSQAMGITTRLNGTRLTTSGDGIWIEDRGHRPDEGDRVATERVGIAYAGTEWIAKPWRFYDRRSRFVSQPR